MHKRLLRVYQVFRHPRNFLVLLLVFLSASLVAHALLGYDADFGFTNLVLSIEASVASAVLMLVAEQSQRIIDEGRIRHGEMLSALLDQTRVLREMMHEHATELRSQADAIERHEEHPSERNHP